ncbi:MAG: YidC/Oxa1 family membrane protein insertase [Ramlibacter sp.]|nr:YidC/Oxa1 family membrane protein insertase [Ramlibacter sp.]
MSSIFESLITNVTRELSIMWRFIAAASGALVLLASLGAQPAYAIPSPELVVGSVTSISQIAAWLWALMAGSLGVLGVRFGMKPAGGMTPSRRRAFAWVIGCLALAALASTALNIYQYSGAKKAKQARLEETLLRPSRQPAGSEKDPDMKEISFREQLKHPLTLSTAQAAEMLEAAKRGDRSDLLFLDVREGAEQAMGTIPGVTFVRFPDFKASNLDFKGKKAVLFCHNGNRSSETCEQLRKMGIDCQFMAGGLEKWVVEGRAMTGLAERSLRELRAIPHYANRDTLLDTADVKKLLKEREAVFVDIRYPTDFAEQHLPDAINLSLRRMSTDLLQANIARLPQRPIILPCYDRRGCFFAEVLGYKLTQAGREVLGRYTVPWEYFVARPRPPHVVKWVEENEKSLWTRTSEKLASGLEATSQWIGILGAIVALALLSRLLVLPFSVKSERDQLVLRRFAADMRDLKARFHDDPVRRGRALQAFHRKHHLTPVRNLTAVLFIPILAVALGAVEMVATRAATPFLWIPNIGKPDPWFALPLVFAALLSWYLDLAYGRSARQRVVMAVMALPAAGALASMFNAGAALYLAASVALLLVQRLVVQHMGQEGVAASKVVIGLPAGVLSLDQADALKAHGNKALHLARLRAGGLPVPEGVVLTPEFLARLQIAGAAEQDKLLTQLWEQLGGQPLAVRSSAAGEDGSDRSYAGVFESVLDVSRAQLQSAINHVLLSFVSKRASEYGLSGSAGSILLQRMVAAEYAGVLFTRAPEEGALAMVELVRGTAQDMVAGIAQPTTFRFGRCTGRLIGQGRSPIDLEPLLALGQRAEALFGAPQDIEWTWKAGQFFLVQSRDVTTGLPAMQQSIADAAEIVAAGRPKHDETVLARNELSEMLPSPTPLSLSLMEAFWASGGSVDLACRRLGLAYAVEEDAPAYLVGVIGRLYVNKLEEHRRALSITSSAASRLGKKARWIEESFRNEFLPPFLREMRLQEVMDFSKLPDAELFRSLTERVQHYLHVTHVEVDVVNVAAHVYVSQATALLEQRGIDAGAILGSIPETCEGAAYRAAAAANGPARGEALRDAIGHRSLVDYELSEPRFSENPGLFDAPDESFAALALAGEKALTRNPSKALLDADKDAKLVQAVERARRFQALKQDARHHSLRELAVIRRLVLATDQRHGFDGLAFYLTLDELLELQAVTAPELRPVACRRQAAHNELLSCAPLPTALSAADLESASAGTSMQIAASGELRGTRVAGAALAITGRACVVGRRDAEKGESIPGFADGDIIVAPMVSPQWVQYFKRAGGFVCETGGWLSHTAILAREYDVTMVVGVRQVENIPHHANLKVQPDGRIELLLPESAIDEIAVGQAILAA